MTHEERQVLDKLTEAWNLFVALPVQHPMHQQEFCMAIHQCQRIIMVRPVERDLKAEDMQAAKEMQLIEGRPGL